jgi:hypothetical protein
MFLHTFLAVNSLYRYPIWHYLVVRRSGDMHGVWWGTSSVLCKWRCSVFCASQPVHSSALCTELCNTATPVQRSVHCTVQHSLSSTALCALHRWCSIWRLKTVTAAVRLLSYRNKKLFVWAVTDRQTDRRAAQCDRQTIASAVGGFVSFTGDAYRLLGLSSLLFNRYLGFSPSINRPELVAGHWPPSSVKELCCSSSRCPHDNFTF